MGVPQGAAGKQYAKFTFWEDPVMMLCAMQAYPGRSLMHTETSLIVPVPCPN